MSNPFGDFGSTGIAIHQEIPENQAGQAIRKTKRDDLQGKPPANKRAALGTITNTTRIQPSRAAKQVRKFSKKWRLTEFYCLHRLIINCHTLVNSHLKCNFES